MKKNTILSSAILVSFLVSLMVVSPVYASPTGLVGDWNLDEGTGSVAADSVNSNDGVLSGGKFGNALYFDGLDDYVSLGSNVFSDSDLATYTLEAWINIGSLDSVERRIFDDEGGLRPMLNSGNKLQAFHWDSTAWTGKTVTMATTPTVGVWYHIAQTYDGVNMKFYVNNGLVGSIASAAWEPDDLNRDANIGTIWNDLGRYWKGLIDEVRLSNTAKTSFTLNAAPEVELGVTVALWHFDDSEGPILSDASGNGYHGTIVGATWVGPTWVSTPTGSGLKFDGVDDYVRVDDTAILDIGVGTWEAVLKFDALPSVVGMMNPLAKANQYWIHASNGVDDPFDDEMIALADSIQAKITIGSSRHVVSTSADFIEVGVWYHVVGTYDGSVLGLYVDGVLVDEKAVSGTINSGGSMLAFGTWSYPVDYFQGELDGIKLWNIPLTDFDLEFDASSSSVVSISEMGTLKVCLTAGSTPIEDMTVKFSSDPTGLLLSSTEAITGSDGCAQITASGDPGVYVFTATVKTAIGDITAEHTLVIYDPSGGFVTGGGWIDSPAGAYADDELLAGKASFGFVSKYKKGATVPTGNTEFIFHAADFKFKSTSYQWLVITGGNKAKFKGEGEVNGVDGYGFMLSATDGGKDGDDTFRIKIWDISSEAIVYDNMGETALGGGSIIVHNK